MVKKFLNFFNLDYLLCYMTNIFLYQKWDFKRDF